MVARGGDGALVSLRGEVFEASGRKVDVVDTVGAGDSFQAGLLCGLDELGKATKSGLSEISPDECRRVVDFAMAAPTCPAAPSCRASRRRRRPDRGASRNRSLCRSLCDAASRHPRIMIAPWDRRVPLGQGRSARFAIRRALGPLAGGTPAFPG